MNNKIYSLLIAMTMIVAGITLTSCGDDGDDLTPAGKATEAYLTHTVYVSESMMDYFDATCTIDGQTITLTKDNTETENMTIAGTVFNLRKYTFAKKTYKSFPSTLNIVQDVKVKQGVNLKEVTRLDKFAMYIHVNFANNNTTNYADGEWKTIKGDFESVFQSGVHFDQMSDEMLKRYQNPTLTTTINMSSANEANINSAFNFSK